MLIIEIVTESGALIKTRNNSKSLVFNPLPFYFLIKMGDLPLYTSASAANSFSFIFMLYALN